MAIYHTLSVFRNIQWSNNAARSGSSEEFLDAHKNATLTSHNPRGHTIGIIGMGNIGYTIATKAYKCFGVKIVYYDLYPKTPEQEKAIEATRIETLDGMLAVSDCVVLATPGAGGKKVIDAETLAKFKKGSRLVNIARGTLVDEEALADALESGHLCAAGLDVHDNEPHVNARLVKRNVSLTCHNAGGAIETNVGFEALAMQNIEAVLTGKAPLTPVNQRMGVFATKGG
jgi:lactate dehydrogenase-like 2-hydroxyacid dehydrogenase